MNGMSNVQGDPMVPFGLIPAPDHMNMSNPNDSRSSSMNRLEDNNSQDRRSVPAPVHQQHYNGSVAHSMAQNINPQLANYSMPTGQNGGMPMFNGPNSMGQSDWSQMFQQGGAQNTYVNHTSFPPNNGQTQTALKAGNNGNPPRPNGTPARSLFFANWGAPDAKQTYQRLSNAITNFFYPPDVIISDQSASMNLYFSADNIKDFLEKFTHFHRHFAILHIPTFDILNAYTGLLASMCCIGACYSDRVSADHVRDMMDFLKVALERDSRMLASLNDGSHREVTGRTKEDMEELQALILLHTLLNWNGTPQQRDGSRQVFSDIANLAHKTGLLRVSQEASLYSLLHQPNFVSSTFNPSSFDWVSWVEQEKRVRVMHMVFMMDAAMGLYFNARPHFDVFEVQLPLPADDAAWDAPDPTSCAEALGLYGSRAAKVRNPDGTQRAKQPELHLTVRALLSSYHIQSGSTNLVSKFIIIHALLAIIRRAQIEGSSAINSGSATPLSQNDWVLSTGQDTDGSNNVSASNSGRATPVEGVISPQTLKILRTALDKFKQNWDIDMVNQFPPSSTSPRRHGFSKDGIHFYWLANYMLQNNRPGDLSMTGDNRFMRVINLLKSVKTWVVSDGAARGEEYGSVNDIDKDFGVTDLTLTLAKLFKPLPVNAQSPTVSIKREIP